MKGPFKYSKQNFCLFWSIFEKYANFQDGRQDFQNRSTSLILNIEE